MSLYNKKAVRVIGKNIKDSLKLYGINIDINYVNNYRTIEVRDENMQLWLRLYVNGDKFNADISTIELAYDIRRMGIFDTLCKRLKNCKYIDVLKITGVCTPEMRNWCNKHKLKEVSMCDFVV